MIERFFPDKEVRCVEDITVEVLREEKIKGLILDIDNTLSEWKTDPSESVIAWLESLKKNGIKLCLVSNNRRSRVEVISKKLSINAVHGAIKPRRKAFLAAIRLMEIAPGETAVVGDQVFTDIYGGNRLNMLTIYVNPINDKDGWLVRFKRPIERWILQHFRAQKFRLLEKRIIWKMRSGRRKLRNYETIKRKGKF